jgi:hypothetical protein
LLLGGLKTSFLFQQAFGKIADGIPDTQVSDSNDGEEN